MTLGQMIGKLQHTFKISEYKGGPSKQCTITIDFSTASDSEIKDWLVSNRIIAGQRPWRAMFKDLETDVDGRTFIAQSIGQKVKSRKERIQDLINAGLPEHLAVYAVDNPDSFNDAVAQIDLNPLEVDND